MSNPLPSAAPTREQASSLWFFAGFIAVILAGIAKIVIADHFSPDSADNSG